MYKTLILLLVFLISIDGHPQDWFSAHQEGEELPGYILGIAGDTIKGTIRYDYPIVMQKRIYFSPGTNSLERKTYNPDNIRGFAVDNRVWVSTPANMETYDGTFAFKRFGILEYGNGPVLLIRIFDEADKHKRKINSEEAEKEYENIALQYPENSVDHLYIRKMDGAAEPINSKPFRKSFVKRIRSYVGDHDALMQKIESKQYRIGDIRTIVSEYNAWFGSKYR